jgi:hypothetical protein
MNADFFIIECICPEEIVKERLNARTYDPTEASDGRWEIFESQKGAFEKIDESPDNHHIIVDSSQTLEMCTEYAIDKIRRGKTD